MNANGCIISYIPYVCLLLPFPVYLKPDFSRVVSLKTIHLNPTKLEGGTPRQVTGSSGDLGYETFKNIRNIVSLLTKYRVRGRGEGRGFLSHTFIFKIRRLTKNHWSKVGLRTILRKVILYSTRLVVPLRCPKSSFDT